MIKGPDSFYIEGFEKLIEEELSFLLNQRGTDDMWDIIWQWADHPDAFAVSRNWWKAHLAIENKGLLKAFGRIEA